MLRWEEYDDCYVVSIRPENSLHKKSIIEIDVDDGVAIVIGEPKSKYLSMHYKLMQMVFSKDVFSFDDACDYFRDHEVRFGNQLNKKVPPIHWLVGMRKGHFVYGVFRCEKKFGGTIKEQLSQDFVETD